MSGKSVHRTRIIVQPSFPNNRRSTRFPRRKVVTKRVWKEEESSAYFGVPDTALFTPFDIPNPLDNAPTLVDYHAIHYSDAGGYAPAQPCPELFGCQPLGPGTPPQFNATEYLSNQFNPFVKENIPPVITNVIWDTKESWGWSWGYPHCEHAWVEIDAYILDVAPYSGWIGVTDRNTYIEFSGTGGQYAQAHHAVIDLDYWGDVIAEYYINVTVWDQASNTAYYEKEVAGILGSFTNFLGDVWNAVCGVFAAAWEMVKSAVSWLVSFINGVVEGLFNLVFTPIINFFKSMAQSLFNAINLMLTATSLDDIIEGIIQLSTLISSTLIIGIIALGVTITTIETLITIFSGGASALMSSVTDLVAPLALVPIIGSISSLIGDSNIIGMFTKGFSIEGLFAFLGINEIFSNEGQNNLNTFSIWTPITLFILAMAVSFELYMWACELEAGANLYKSLISLAFSFFFSSITLLLPEAIGNSATSIFCSVMGIIFAANGIAQLNSKSDTIEKAISFTSEAATAQLKFLMRATRPQTVINYIGKLGQTSQSMELLRQMKWAKGCGSFLGILTIVFNCVVIGDIAGLYSSAQDEAVV